MEYSSSGNNNVLPMQEKTPIMAINADCKAQNKEILWNVINSCLAGFLVMFGGFIANQEITTKLIFTSIALGCMAAIVQFKKFWETEQSSFKLFKFL